MYVPPLLVVFFNFVRFSCLIFYFVVVKIGDLYTTPPSSSLRGVGIGPLLLNKIEITQYCFYKASNTGYGIEEHL